VSGSVRRAAIIGNASLAGHCTDLALKHGIEIVVVATEHPQVRDHAASLGIPVVHSAGDVAVALDPYEFDVLFSIANLRVLPQRLLDRALIAINFHDGPLPAYVGLNVTTWALLAGEQEHAITWHLMTAEVDGGDVVALERFPISPDDTAFSLNARCYEAAIDTFPGIVDALVAGTLATAPQPPVERRVFSRFERPVAIVDPTHDANDIERVIRSLALGHAASNSIGSVHLLAAGGHVIITAARAVASNGSPVGTLTVEPAGLRFAATGGDLVIDGIETVAGRTVTPIEALVELGLVSGDRITAPATDLVGALRAADPTLARHESYWRALLQGATPVAPSVLEHVAGPARLVRRPLAQGVTTDDVIAAVAAWAWRLGGIGDATIGITDAVARRSLSELAPLLHIPVMRFAIDETTTFDGLVVAAAEQRSRALDHGPFLADLIGREPTLIGNDVTPQVTVDLDGSIDQDGATHPLGGLRIGIGDGELRFTSTLASDILERIADQLSVLLAAGSSAPVGPIADLELLGPSEHTLLDAVNRTEMAFDRDATVDRLVAAQATRTPDAPAVSSGDITLSYRELLDQVAAMATRLADSGVRPRDRVGIALQRGADMLIAVLATHACGAAYVPLDPTYPAERLRLMVTDSGLRTAVAEPDITVLDDVLDGVVVLHPVDPGSSAPTVLPATDHGASDLAYVIYTSGSTGTPKGVMLEHRNVVNFFAAMDAVIEHDPPGVWLAVTSLSFDISVLELLWTLTRGFHVVIKPDGGTKGMQRVWSSPRPLTMSLFYFAAGEDTAHDGYRLLLDSARWADTHGFAAVWTPERHFHAFGGAYPNPAVVGAALAAVTDNVRIRAGSVVAPLHSPARIAEEWAVVDNLSGGRVDISFAAGWQPNDFVLNPGAYATARDQLPTMIDTVRRLWRGDTVDMPGHDGAPVGVRTLPRPVQPELPVWLTSAGSTSTFERAGTLGTNLLTHLLGQSIEQLTENIACYRAAWKTAGHPGQGQVTLMLHTYLHPDSAEARRVAHGPMKAYLGSAAGLLKNMASAFPTFAGSGKSADEAFASLTTDEMDQLLEMAAGRYLETSGLFGTVDDAVDMIERCSRAGVDEVACLIDFGVDTDAVLDSLPLLGAAYNRAANLRKDASTGAESVDVVSNSVADLVALHRVTHLQCTPSLATMLVADPADRAALGTIGHVMLGGEPLPTALAGELMGLLPGRLTNMYGPTETTIWSLVHEVTEPPTGLIPIGRPIGNNTIHVLDQRGNPLPIGSFGELHIGGDSVARGYHDRPELTGERFVDRPGLGRVYATGDIVRIGPDGVVEFAGRSDLQVKIRGHRIELGEIETIIDEHPDVVQSVVVAHRSELGDPTLIAFVVSHSASDVDESSVRALIGERLPDAYLPARIIRLDEFPLTPNGKTDRGRLEADVDEHLAAALPSDVVAEVFDDATEQLVAEVWTAELHHLAGRDDNFFDIGGNSLLAVAVFRRISDRTDTAIALTDVFRYPTIRMFAAHLSRAGSQGKIGAPVAGERSAGDDAPTGIDRGAMRRRALARRSS